MTFDITEADVTKYLEDNPAEGVDPSRRDIYKNHWPSLVVKYVEAVNRESSGEDWGDLEESILVECHVMAGELMSEGMPYSSSAVAILTVAVVAMADEVLAAKKAGTL